ncbi:MAG TPA: translesion error-prone DNA polymerase V autoproteolytic subunit, partial [Pelagibacterales bacterium]|nr:translesion error-prone DNA polymerase V autoproteolytic subunit [Pelagibacterales bacterium]
ALCRKNMGCSHFVVGRDHTGVADYYAVDASQRFFDKLGDIGIEPIFLNMMSEYKNLDLFSIIKKTQINTPVFLDKVSAGFPSPATDYMENKLDLNEYLIRHPAATFIVKASGSSMVNADIYSGDLLIVDRSVTPKSNNIVIASIFGDLTVKKLKKKEKSFFLISANDEYPSIEVKEEMECFIWGVVTYIIHETTSS